MRVRFAPLSGTTEAFEVQAGTYTECLANALDRLGYALQKVDRIDELQASPNNKDAKSFSALVYAIDINHSRIKMGEIEGFAVNFDDVKRQAQECFLDNRLNPAGCRLDVRVNWRD